MTELKTLKEIYPDDWDSLNVRKEAIKWIKKQKVKANNDIVMFYHCKNCLNKGEPSGLLECGHTSSLSKEILKCKNCGSIVKIFNHAEMQNAWIEHFFNITKEDLK